MRRSRLKAKKWINSFSTLRRRLTIAADLEKVVNVLRKEKTNKEHSRLFFPYVFPPPSENVLILDCEDMASKQTKEGKKTWSKEIEHETS